MRLVSRFVRPLTRTTLAVSALALSALAPACDDAEEGVDPDPVVAPPAAFPPILVDHRTHPGLWLQVFEVAPDGASLLTPVEAEGSTEASPKAVLGRIDTTTLTVRRDGPALFAGERSVDLWPSPEPGVVWVVDYLRRALFGVDVGTLAAGPDVALPDSPSLRVATWAPEGRRVAFAHGTTDELDAALALALPDDPMTLTPAAIERAELTMAPSSFVRARLTDDGLLAIAGAPAGDDPECGNVCIAEPDVEAGFFTLRDVDADPTTPVLDEARYDQTFRTSPSGRWLYRNDLASGGVRARDLTAAPAVERALPCADSARMELAADDGVTCLGLDAEGATRLFVLDADQSPRLDVPVARPPETEIVMQPGGRRAWVGGALVDLGVTPPVVRETDVTDLNAIAAAQHLWVFGDTVRRVTWEGGAVVDTGVPAGDVCQLEALGDGGFALARFGAIDRIEVFAPDGSSRGAVSRTLVPTP